LNLVSSLLRPIQAFRVAYVPLVMVYFAYGALGLIDVTRDLWIKEKLTLTPSDLAGIGVWLTLPWTVKMVFGELVDCVPIFGSQRRAYILIGATFTACGLVILAGAAGGWLVVARPDHLYVFGALLIVLGTVIQDVVADAMSTEVVARVDDDGKRSPRNTCAPSLAWCRCSAASRSRPAFSRSPDCRDGCGPDVARKRVPAGLVIPAISITGVFLIRSETAERRAIDWRILGGGLAFGAVVVALALGGVPFAQEIIFVISMGVICTMLVFVTRELAPATRRAILYTTIIIFAFRATPAVGDGYFWWTLDVLKFDADSTACCGRPARCSGWSGYGCSPSS
jgi:hypothetical protein